jgi:UDP-2,3-diacylglucosamine pyrophosphatase LpxH
MSVICVGFITDPHIPFHSRKALSAAMNCLADSNLYALYLGGDVFDMYWANNHGPKDPRIFSTLESEREEVNKFLDQIDLTWPTIQKRFIEGNHETRFERYLIQNAPAIFGITSIPHLIGMDKRPRWSYHPYGTDQLVQIGKTNLFVKHAPKGSSGPAIMNHNACNLLFGHVHRIIQEFKTTGDGRILRAVSPGWLGEGRNRAFHYVPGHQNWQQGFARIWIDISDWSWRVEVIEIIDNSFCMASGKKYIG